MPGDRHSYPKWAFVCLNTTKAHKPSRKEKASNVHGCLHVEWLVLSAHTNKRRLPVFPVDTHRQPDILVSRYMLYPRSRLAKVEGIRRVSDLEP
jgi:hypothetical protein